MKILMEDVLQQFDEKKGINSYLEAKKPMSKKEKGIEEFASTYGKPPKKNLSQPKKASKPIKGQFDDFGDEDDEMGDMGEDEDGMEAAEDVASDIFDAVQAKVMKLINMKAVEKAFNQELKAQCKQYGVDENEVIEIIQSHIHDMDIEDLGITDILFYGAFN